MEIKISGTPEEIKELLQVIVSNEEQKKTYESIKGFYSVLKKNYSSL